MQIRIKDSLKDALIHLLFFVIVEIAFAFIVLHEFPSVGLLSTIGFVHFSYWILIVVRGVIRPLLKNFVLKFLTTFIPLLYHVLGHILIGFGILGHSHEHSLEHEVYLGDYWLIVSTIILGVFILFGEYLLHKRDKLKLHHQRYHDDCID